MARWQYLFKVMAGYVLHGDSSCPHCGHAHTQITGRKFGLLQLRFCPECRLQFRYPKDSEAVNRAFYSGIYQEDEGITTNAPEPQRIPLLLSNRFQGTDKNFDERIATLRRYRAGGTLLDYGASWGYGTWQLAQAGYQAIGYEIDEARTEYGRWHLNIGLTSDWADLADKRFDILFTSHVIEHLPDLRDTFSRFHGLLNPDGLLCIFVPNCTGVEQPAVFARKREFAFGEKHTIAYTADFFAHNLPRHGFTPLTIDVTPHHTPKADLINGSELLVVAQRV
jgi:SAM-dependent methyltransferase